MTEGQAYTEEESRRILERAAERQEEAERAALTSGGRMSVDELKSIAAEVGIDPSHVQAAARELVLHRDQAPVTTRLGVPGELTLTRMIPGTVSEGQWGRMVSVLRDAFDRPGIVSSIGDVHEWISSNSSSDGSPVKVRVEPEADGTRLTLYQSTKAYTTGGTVLAATFGTMSTLSALLIAFGTFPSQAWIVPVLMALLGVLGLSGGTMVARSAVGKQDRKFDAVADKLELIGRPQEPHE